ncbi:hypothetical protein EZS27_008220 [termite gut metagenome]|uniref:Outer membrane protein beta-barrel domain-containing protein n=1 Tax=termite gut metagenome TaxID=433724 RepID=A0A5J4SE27_9ZZZZ
MKKIILSVIVLSQMTAIAVYGQTETQTQTQQKGTTTRTETVTQAGGVYTRTVTETNAQNVGVAFGFKANVNLSGFIINDMNNSDSRMKPGGSVGGLVKIAFTKGFAMQPEIIVHYKESERWDKTMNTTSDYQYWGVEIPVYYMGQITMGAGKWLIGAGPYVAFGINAQRRFTGGETVDLYQKDAMTGDAAMQRWDFGAGIFAGYEWRNSFTITGGYQLGFLDMLDAGRKTADMNNQTLYVGIEWKFWMKK